MSLGQDSESPPKIKMYLKYCFIKKKKLLSKNNSYDAMMHLNLEGVRKSGPWMLRTSGKRANCFCKMFFCFLEMKHLLSKQIFKMICFIQSKYQAFANRKQGGKQRLLCFCSSLLRFLGSDIKTRNLLFFKFCALFVLFHSTMVL